MTKSLISRKRRTREHVIADQSVNYLERFIIDAGHTAQRVEKDYGYDLLPFTYDELGYCEPDFLPLQLKAAATWPATGTALVFDLDIRDYNLWMLERMPVILVLFDASRKRAWWLAVQDFFREDPSHLPKKGAKSVRNYVPLRQVVSQRAIAKMRTLKGEARSRALGANV